MKTTWLSRKCASRILLNSREGGGLKLPSSLAEEGEALAILDAIESENLETRISDAASPVGNLPVYV